MLQTIMAIVQTKKEKLLKLLSKKNVSREVTSSNSPVRLYTPLIQREYACACDGGCPSCYNTLPLQTELTISQRGDIHEQEAENIANQLTQYSRITSPKLKQKTNHQIGKGKLKENGYIFNSFSTTEDKNPFKVIQGIGRPLPRSLRTSLEPMFGYNFNQTRLHVGSSAAASAQMLNARAYTIGHNIVFGVGEYSPNTTRGYKLIVHELTHVKQQDVNTNLNGTIQRFMLLSSLQGNPKEDWQEVVRTTNKALYDFLTGNKTSYSLGPFHPWTIRLQNHPHLEKVRENIEEELLLYCEMKNIGIDVPEGIEGVDNFNLNDLSWTETAIWFGKDVLSWLSGGRLGQERAFIFGSFRLNWCVEGVDIFCFEDRVEAMVYFEANDLLHLRSALRIPKTDIGPPDEPFGEGKPFNNIPIKWNWNEMIVAWF